MVVFVDVRAVEPPLPGAGLHHLKVHGDHVPSEGALVRPTTMFTKCTICVICVLCVLYVLYFHGDHVSDLPFQT